MKNIFFTGAPGVGKSTLINRLIRELNITNIGGYFTAREVSSESRVFWIVDRNTKKRRLMARIVNGRPTVYRDAFEPFGIAAITRPCAILILDELGRFEEGCEAFKAAVHRALSGDTPVIGVLKICDAPFVASVAVRSDVTVLTVTEDNRELCYNSARSVVQRFASAFYR